MFIGYCDYTTILQFFFHKCHCDTWTKEVTVKHCVTVSDVSCTFLSSKRNPSFLPETEIIAAKSSGNVGKISALIVFFGV